MSEQVEVSVSGAVCVVCMSCYAHGPELRIPYGAKSEKIDELCDKAIQNWNMPPRPTWLL